LVWRHAETASVSHGWVTACDRAVRLANHLLAESGSAERFYYEHTGNDSTAILLTEPMRDALLAYGAIQYTAEP
jgi:hypothetical protein